MDIAPSGVAAASKARSRARFVVVSTGTRSCSLGEDERGIDLRELERRFLSLP